MSQEQKIYPSLQLLCVEDEILQVSNDSNQQNDGENEYTEFVQENIGELKIIADSLNISFTSLDSTQQNDQLVAQIKQKKTVVKKQDQLNVQRNLLQQQQISIQFSELLVQYQLKLNQKYILEEDQQKTYQQDKQHINEIYKQLDEIKRMKCLWDSSNRCIFFQFLKNIAELQDLLEQQYIINQFNLQSSETFKPLHAHIRLFILFVTNQTNDNFSLLINDILNLDNGYQDLILQLLIELNVDFQRINQIMLTQFLLNFKYEINDTNQLSLQINTINKLLFKTQLNYQQILSAMQQILNFNNMISLQLIIKNLIIQKLYNNNYTDLIIFIKYLHPSVLQITQLNKLKELNLLYIIKMNRKIDFQYDTSMLLYYQQMLIHEQQHKESVYLNTILFLILFLTSQKLEQKIICYQILCIINEQNLTCDKCQNNYQVSCFFCQQNYNKPQLEDDDKSNLILRSSPNVYNVFKQLILQCELDKNIQQQQQYIFYQLETRQIRQQVKQNQDIDLANSEISPLQQQLFSSYIFNIMNDQLQLQQQVIDLCLHHYMQSSVQQKKYIISYLNSIQNYDYIYFLESNNESLYVFVITVLNASLSVLSSDADNNIIKLINQQQINQFMLYIIFNNQKLVTSGKKQNIVQFMIKIIIISSPFCIANIEQQNLFLYFLNILLLKINALYFSDCIKKCLVQSGDAQSLLNKQLTYEEINNLFIYYFNENQNDVTRNEQMFQMKINTEVNIQILFVFIQFVNSDYQNQLIQHLGINIQYSLKNIILLLQICIVQQNNDQISTSKKLQLQQFTNILIQLITQNQQYVELIQIIDILKLSITQYNKTVIKKGLEIVNQNFCKLYQQIQKQHLDQLQLLLQELLKIEDPIILYYSSSIMNQINQNKINTYPQINIILNKARQYYQAQLEQLQKDAKVEQLILLDDQSLLKIIHCNKEQLYINAVRYGFFSLVFDGTDQDVYYQTQYQKVNITNSCTNSFKNTSATSSIQNINFNLFKQLETNSLLQQQNQKLNNYSPFNVSTYNSPNIDENNSIVDESKYKQYFISKHLIFILLKHNQIFNLKTNFQLMQMFAKICPLQYIDQCMIIVQQSINQLHNKSDIKNKQKNDNQNSLSTANYNQLQYDLNQFCQFTFQSFKNLFIVKNSMFLANSDYSNKLFTLLIKMTANNYILPVDAISTALFFLFLCKNCYKANQLLQLCIQRFGYKTCIGQFKFSLFLIKQHLILNYQLIDITCYINIQNVFILLTNQDDALLTQLLNQFVAEFLDQTILQNQLEKNPNKQTILQTIQYYFKFICCFLPINNNNCNIIEYFCELLIDYQQTEFADYIKELFMLNQKQRQQKVVELAKSLISQHELQLQ